LLSAATSAHPGRAGSRPHQHGQADAPGQANGSRPGRPGLPRGHAIIIDRTAHALRPPPPPTPPFDPVTQCAITAERWHADRREHARHCSGSSKSAQASTIFARDHQFGLVVAVDVATIVAGQNRRHSAACPRPLLEVWMGLQRQRWAPRAASSGTHRAASGPPPGWPQLGERDPWRRAPSAEAVRLINSRRVQGWRPSTLRLRPCAE